MLLIIMKIKRKWDVGAELNESSGYQDKKNIKNG